MPGTTEKVEVERDSSFWLAAAAKPIFFFLALLTLAGIYMAFQVPISVFPETSFPRVVIGVDNGVMPRAAGCESFAAADRQRSAFSSTGMWICSVPSS